MIQLSDVRVFLEILSAGSLTGAGAALGLPKSSVARQLARLEGDVGCRLFERTSRSLALSDQGRVFVPHARRLLDDSIEAERVLQNKGKGAYGLLAVSTTSLFGRAFLAPLLPAFRERNPNVQIMLLLGSGRAEIGSGPNQVDVAIRLRTEAQPNIGSRKLGQIDFRLVAAPAYLQRKPEIMEPDDLHTHNVIELGPRGKDHRIELIRGRIVRPFQYKPIMQIDDPEAAMAATLAGGGVCSLPAFLVADAIRAGTLTHVLPGWAPSEIPISMIYRTEVSPPLRVRAFVDFLSETIGRDQPWRVRDV